MKSEPGKDIWLAGGATVVTDGMHGMGLAMVGYKRERETGKMDWLFLFATGLVEVAHPEHRAHRGLHEAPAAPANHVLLS